MKKHRGISLRRAMALHLRAAKDVNPLAPGLFLSGVLASGFKALSPYGTIWLSARLIDELGSHRRPDVLWQWTVLLVGVTALLGLGKAGLERWHRAKRSLYYRQYQRLFTEKFLTMDYGTMDDQKVRDLFTQIQQNENWDGWGFGYLDQYAAWFSEALAGILGAAVLTISLFTYKVPETAGAFVLLDHPLIETAVFAALLGTVCVGPILHGRANAGWGRLAEVSRFGNRAFSHFQYAFCREVENAMDIRMYRQDELAEHYSRNTNIFGVGSPFAKFMNTTMGLCNGLTAASLRLLSGGVYVFLCLKAWAGAFGVGSVTQYVGAATALSDKVSRLLTTLRHIQTNAEFLQKAYEFLDIPSSMYQGSLTTEKRSDRQYQVEFRDVSFRYPGSQIWALRHVSMKFQIGSRLAIVGENGSGKTTFIKLLCRLYDPQEGEILLNGIDIRKYRYDDYRTLFSVVFQDFQLICQPLGANVAGSMEYDRERVEKALLDAGFGERLASMESGLETMLYRELTEEGVTISGGEAQKIAIARALYRDSPFIILDEPTASLDPVAEAEIYSRFNAIVGDKTAVYISHRLSSCRFCHEIAVFHEGTVIQQGTHEQLLAQEHGKYQELWNAQAQYYTERKQPGQDGIKNINSGLK